MSPLKNTAFKIFDKFRIKEGFKIKNFKEGFSMNLDMSEVLENGLYYGIYEKEIKNVFKNIIKEGMTVVDVGANVGYYTLLSFCLIGYTGNIYSFEPTSIFKRLKENIDNQEYLYFWNVKLHNVALSNFNGEKKGLIRSSYKIKDPFFPEISNLKEFKKKWVGYSESSNFKYRTLDSYKLDKVDFIKIDVDGDELNVLKGAIETIKQFKPIMIIEVHNEHIKEMKDILKPFKYNFKEISVGGSWKNMLCSTKLEDLPVGI